MGKDIITIDSDEQLIKRLEAQLAAATAATAAAEAATTAAEAEAAFWRQRLEMLLASAGAATAAAETATTAAEATSTYWKQRFEALLADTLRRVQALRQRAVVSDEGPSSIERAGGSNLQHINQNGGEETSGH